MLELRIMQGAQALPIFDLPAHLGRHQAARAISDTVEGLIAYLDDLGGDPDLEDGETGSSTVDASGRYLGNHVPEEQDEDREPDDDAKGDLSWPEWHTRGRRKLTSRGAEGPTHSRAGWQLTDDDEDDDQDEADDDTEANGDERDTGNAEDESLIDGGVSASGPGCVISDSDRGDD